MKITSISCVLAAVAMALVAGCDGEAGGEGGSGADGGGGAGASGGSGGSGGAGGSTSSTTSDTESTTSTTSDTQTTTSTSTPTGSLCQQLCEVGLQHSCFAGDPGLCVLGCESNYTMFPACKDLADALYACAIEKVPAGGCDVDVICSAETSAFEECAGLMSEEEP